MLCYCSHLTPISLFSAACVNSSPHSFSPTLSRMRFLSCMQHLLPMLSNPGPSFLVHSSTNPDTSSSTAPHCTVSILSSLPFVCNQNRFIYYQTQNRRIIDQGDCCTQITALIPRDIWYKRKCHEDILSHRNRT